MRDVFGTRSAVAPCRSFCLNCDFYDSYDFLTNRIPAVETHGRASHVASRLPVIAPCRGDARPCVSTAMPCQFAPSNSFLIKNNRNSCTFNNLSLSLQTSFNTKKNNHDTTHFLPPDAFEPSVPTERFSGGGNCFCTRVETFFTLTEKLFTLRKKFFTLTEKFFTLRKKFFTLKKKFFTLRKKFFTLKEKFFTLTEKFFTLKKKFFTLTEKLFTPTEKLFTLTEKLFTPTKKLFTLTKKLFTLTERRFNGVLISILLTNK
jgi:hypothetical protein